MKISLPDRFDLIRHLNSTEVSGTFLVNDRLLERSNVLVKVFRRGSFSASESVARFLSWHQNVVHPNIVGILDAGLCTRGDLYYVRQYLSDFQFPKSFDPVFIGQLISVVSFLLSKQQPHGGIKPSNLFVTSDTLQLADARIPLKKSSTLKDEDVRFTAPELLANSQEPSIESDLYSLGAILYRIYSGRDPFDDSDINNLKSKYVWAARQPLANIAHVTRRISELVHQLMDTNPLSRRAAFAGLQDDLGQKPVVASRAPFLSRELDIQLVDEQSKSRGLRSLTVFFLHGEPGVGKTRLIQELEKRSAFQGIEFVMGTCHVRSTDLKPLLQSLRRLIRRREGPRTHLREEIMNFYPHLFTYLFSDEDPQLQHTNKSLRDQLTNSITGLFGRLTRQRRVTVVIEDVQWADDATLDVLRQLSFRALETPLRLILTARTSGQPLPIVTQLTECLGPSFIPSKLMPLSEATARILADYLVIEPQNVDQVCAWAKGNPQLITAYASHKVGLGCTLPAGIRSMFSETLETLSKSACIVSECISLFDKPTDIELVRIISELPQEEFEVSVQQLQSVGLVGTFGPNIFLQYEAARTTIYSEIPVKHRQRLHRLAFTHLAGRNGNQESTARHGLAAGAYQAALDLYRRLAKEAREQGKWAEALRFYNETALCCRKLKTKPLADDECDRALCYIPTGRPGKARKILHKLCALSAVRQNPQLISAVYAGLATPYQHTSVSEQIKFYRMAIAALPKQCAKATTLHIHLSQALICNGDLTEAARVLSLTKTSLKNSTHSQDTMLFRSALGFLLLHRGDFQKGAAVLKSIKSANRRVMMSALTNAALCVEHLGDIRRAKDLQLKAAQIAAETGFVFLQVLSLGNLGSFETKLGNFNKAGEHFLQARNLMNNLRIRDRHFDFEAFSGIRADMAVLQMNLGRYREASEYLRYIRLAEVRIETERLQIMLVQCELNFLFAKTRPIRRILTTLKASPVFSTDFFRVESMLLETRLDDVGGPDKLVTLTAALNIATTLGTVHQSCRLLLEIATILLSLNQLKEARVRAAEASRAARKQGYKPLVARAQFVRALAAEHHLEKQHLLLEAFRLASEIGLRELLAECAFQMGSFQMERGHYGIAHEYLMKSSAMVTELSEHVPVRFRSAYLAKRWRQQSRLLFKECDSKVGSHMVSGGDFVEAVAFRGDDRFFRALYRVTVAASTAKNVAMFVPALMQTVETSLKRPAVVMLRDGDKISWHPVLTKMSDDLAKRVASLSDKAQEKVYFGGQDKTLSTGTVAWIPFRAQHYRGGIYVACRRREVALAEKEMEFLAILGTIAGGALDQVQNRQIEMSTTPPLAVTGFSGIVGTSRAMREVYSQIEASAGSTVTVLIEGESGTGKELVARAIHGRSARAKCPFVAVDCGAIPETLIESELFGARKGSFTGATADRQGLIESADHGTIFLDEIANTSPALQAKLLRVLQEREVRRIGDTRGRHVDVRLIVASNRDLDSLVRDGKFRHDLLYRLKVLQMTIPPLRNRREDIPMLANSFLRQLNDDHKHRKRFADGALTPLATYGFPGNVRELQNLIERAFFLSKGTVIGPIAVQDNKQASAPTDDIQVWFKDLTEGRKDFWTTVYERYKRRDISREKVIALLDLGLRSTRGSYKMLASLFRVRDKGYRRLMDFLRRNGCLLDFRPYRKPAGESPPQALDRQ